MSKIFETASKVKLRAQTAKGLLNVEQLWDLPLSSGVANLYDIEEQAIDALQSMSSSGTRRSASVTNQREVAQAQLLVDILKYIIDAREDEAKTKSVTQEKQEELRRLKNLLANKKIEAEGELSIDEVEKKIAELG